MPLRCSASENRICLPSHSETIIGKSSGAEIFGRPKRTPFALAAAIPSACRFRMFSRSFCAITLAPSNVGKTLLDLTGNYARLKQSNEKIYYIVDTLIRAILKKRKSRSNTLSTISINGRSSVMEEPHTRSVPTPLCGTIISTMLSDTPTSTGQL